MDMAALREELSWYRGAPQCMDCKWKLGTDITDNCSCRGNRTDAQKAKHTAAFNRARELQTLLEPQTENGTMYEKQPIARSFNQAGQSMPPAPVSDGSVAHAVESLEKQICATGEVLIELGRRLDRVLIPLEPANNQVPCGDTPLDPRVSPLTNSLAALDRRLASVRNGMEELIRRINL